MKVYAFSDSCLVVPDTGQPVGTAVCPYCDRWNGSLKGICGVLMQREIDMDKDGTEVGCGA